MLGASESTAAAGVDEYDLEISALLNVDFSGVSDTYLSLNFEC